MTTEASFIAALRAIATVPAARGLVDDAAVLDIGGSRLVLTMDAIVEGVHFLPDDPPQTVAWKLVATNVSDLAAKGAEPRGCLLSYPLAAAETWNAAFLEGLAQACSAFAIPLLGGDTVRPLEGAARHLSLVALGEPNAGIEVPSRSGARPGDMLWVSGPIGDAGLGLSLLQGKRRAGRKNHDVLVDRYRRPTPNVALGIALAPQVHAMMDVSDGVLIDAGRLASASNAAVVLELDRLPLSAGFVDTCGDGLSERLFAASAGDDYCLMFAASPEAEAAIKAAVLASNGAIFPVGRVMGGRGISLQYGGETVPLPARLGYEH